MFSKVVACFGDLCLVLWCYKRAVQHCLKYGERARQGEHRVGAERRGQNGVGGFQAGRHCLEMGDPGRRGFYGRISWPTHCRYSLPLLAFSLIGVMISSGCGVPAHSQDASEAHRSVPPVLNIIQVVGRRAPFAPICHKRSTPSPLPS